MKNFNIMGVHWKTLFLGEVKKKQYRGNCLKLGGRGLGQFADLRKGLAKKRGVVVLRGEE